MALLPSIVRWNPQRDHQHLVILQSSAAQSSFPVLRQIVRECAASHGSRPPRLLLFCLLSRPSSLFAQSLTDESLDIYDWVGNIPGYYEGMSSTAERILRIVDNVPKDVSLNVIIDSVDTLMLDEGTITGTYKGLRELSLAISRRPAPSRLILHITQTSQLLPTLLQYDFCSSSLTHLIAHPPALLNHIAVAYLTAPPPLSPPEKFWAVFLPVSERISEVRRLVYGPRGDGPSNQEIVVEILLRRDSTLRKDRGVTRVLEGWAVARGGPCEITGLESCKDIWSKRIEDQREPALEHVSFNLNLTESQQRSRSQVPLPYVHEGKSSGDTSTILYDPDSADDIDDDDPDEDLNI